MSNTYESLHDESNLKLDSLSQEEEYTAGMIIANMIQEDDKTIVYPGEHKECILELEGMIIPNLSHPFHIKPIYIGDADDGTEGIAGHERHYKIGCQIYITKDDNKNGDELLVATMVVDYYNDIY